MNSEYLYDVLSREIRDRAEASVEHYMQVKEAEKSLTGHLDSKMLVKLAKVLILAGERLKSHAERDLKRPFPSTSLQKL